MAQGPRLVLPNTARSALKTASGLLVPSDTSQQELDDHPGVQFIGAFLTYEEMGGEPMDEAGIAERLAKISAYDCLQALGRISCMLHAGSLNSINTQLLIMRRLGWNEEVRNRIELVLRSSDTGPRPMFFPQQIVHLARLAVRHADDRPSDGFDGGQLIDDFIACLLGVTDILGGDEDDLDEHRVDSVVPWIVRQWTMNGRQDSVLLWTRYYDVLIRTWEQVATPEAFEAGKAFRRYTGIGLQDWLTVGFGLYIRFLNYGQGPSDDQSSDDEYYLQPSAWFSKSAIGEDLWRPFLGRNAQTLAECRDALAAEDTQYGPTLYRCQTFEQRPLLDFGDGRFTPLALDSLERRATEGMFFELADGSQKAGLPREHFTAPFGAVFEEFIQRAFERMLPPLGTSRVHRPQTYIRKGLKVESPDAALDLGDAVAFVEVTARRPQVATLTRGDFTTFQDDLEKGVLRKAKQLSLNIDAYRTGTLAFAVLRYVDGQEIWPLLITVEGFPTMPPIPQVIAKAVNDQDWPKGVPPPGILGADDVAILESLLEAGFSLLELLRGWNAEEMRDLPFQNYIYATEDDRLRSANRASFYEDAWNELMDRILNQVFPGTTMPRDET